MFDLGEIQLQVCENLKKVKGEKVWDSQSSVGLKESTTWSEIIVQMLV